MHSRRMQRLPPSTRTSKIIYIRSNSHREQTGGWLKASSRTKAAKQDPHRVRKQKRCDQVRTRTSNRGQRRRGVITNLQILSQGRGGGRVPATG